jgi:hypothetical protein
MAVTGFDEEREPLIIERDIGTEGMQELRRPWTVRGIAAVALPAGVVEERENLHDARVGAGGRREASPVLKDARPVRHTVDTTKG